MLDGDSITDHINGWSYAYFINIPLLKSTFNVALSGATTDDLLASAPTNVDPHYDSTLYPNISVIWAGTNDCGHDTAAQSWANLAAYSAARHAIGFKTIIVTMMSFFGRDACKDALNPLIVANWPGVFDGLADVAANPLVGADGAYANLTYFQADRGHPTNFSAQTVIAPIIQPVIESLFPRK